MPYKRMSELVQEIGQDQRSDTFVQLFRAAVREGKFDAMDLTERFTLPKQYARRGGGNSYQRAIKDMLVEVTPALEAWLRETSTSLARTPRTRKVKPTVEAIESGAFDFKAAAEETRRKMQSKFEKGQRLGQGRARVAKKK